MKKCPFCKEEILDEAVKCRYCTSDVSKEAEKQTVYILDQGLVRYVKVAGGFLALFVAAGVFLFGYNLNETAKEVGKTAKEADQTRKDAEKASHDADGARKDTEKAAQETAETLRKVKAAGEIAAAQRVELERIKTEVAQLRDEAKQTVEGIRRSQTEAVGILGSIKVSASSITTFGPDRASSLFEALVVKHFAGVLTAEQMKKLKENAAHAAVPKRFQRDEIAKLLQVDMERAAGFFARHGFKDKKIAFLISEQDDLMNSYWDGTQVVYGMGMANSEIFGPYESGIVFHEASHSLFDIPFTGESGSVSEHICDVLAVVIRGDGWTIGSVRSSDPARPQFLRSLEAPGTAYDTQLLGKDPQPDTMAKFVKTEDDLGGVHINVGILNKAAFLISEGIQQGDSPGGRGIGRAKLGQLYVETVKSLKNGEYVSFRSFKEQVIKTAERIFSDQKDVEAVRKGFKVVGL